MNKNMRRKIIWLLAFLTSVNFIFSFSAPALAAGTVDDLWGGAEQKNYVINNSGLPANTTASDPRKIASNIIRFVLGFLGILSVCIIIYAGFKWMTSGGNEETVSDAKKMLIAALIGLIIILLAYAIANFVLNALYDITD